MMTTRLPWPAVVLMSALLVLAAVAPSESQTLPPPRPVAAVPAAETGHPPAALGLGDLVGLSLERNPQLIRAGLEVDVARGRAVQAGLYPNPTTHVVLDELGDRTGPGGVNTVPLITQEIVTGHKLRLSRTVAEREVDQATLALLQERYALFTRVRQAYFVVLAAQRRVEILAELVQLATQSFDNAQKLLGAGEAAKPDVLQFQIELDRFRAQLEAAQQELAAAWPRLAASVGVPNLPCVPLAGSLEAALPDYDFCRSQTFMLEVHPEVRWAEVGVTRAQVALKRAQVEPIPNVTLGAGYVRQNQNKSDDWVFQASVPVPVFNRNQGNILAAQAEVGRAIQEVDRVRYDLTNRLAAAFGRYAGARKQAERYRGSILPAARESFRLTLAAFRGGQFEYLRVLQAQRAIAEANLEYVRALAEQWQAASEIAGLLLEEQWPASLVGPCEAAPQAPPPARPGG